MDMEQQPNDVRLDADRQKLDYRNFMGDEEVTLLHHKRDLNVPDNPGLDVRDGLETSDTQREDWLLLTEPLHGARPRRTATERPPLIDDHTGVMDLQAAAGTGGRKVEQHTSQAPLRSSERQILMEEVTTPPRGGRPAPVTQVPLGGREPCLRFLQKSVDGMVGRTGRRMIDGSPVDMLADMVARMQLDLADLRAENRMLRTLGVTQVARSPRQVAFTTTKVPRFDGTTSWEQYKQVFRRYREFEWLGQ